MAPWQVMRATLTILSYTWLCNGISLHALRDTLLNLFVKQSSFANDCFLFLFTINKVFPTFLESRLYNWHNQSYYFHACFLFIYFLIQPIVFVYPLSATNNIVQVVLPYIDKANTTMYLQIHYPDAFSHLCKVLQLLYTIHECLPFCYFHFPFIFW